MDPDLKQYLADMEERILKRGQDMAQRILERTQEMVRDAQTEILRGFERF